MSTWCPDLANMLPPAATCFTCWYQSDAAKLSLMAVLCVETHHQRFPCLVEYLLVSCCEKAKKNKRLSILTVDLNISVLSSINKYCFWHCWTSCPPFCFCVFWGKTGGKSGKMHMETQCRSSNTLSTTDGDGLLMWLVCKSFEMSFNDSGAVWSWSLGKSCWDQIEPSLNICHQWLIALATFFTAHWQPGGQNPLAQWPMRPLWCNHSRAHWHFVELSAPKLKLQEVQSVTGQRVSLVCQIACFDERRSTQTLSRSSTRIKWIKKYYF